MTRDHASHDDLAPASGDEFQGMDLLYLTTVGARSGLKRQSTVARFPDGEDAWLAVTVGC